MISLPGMSGIANLVSLLKGVRPQKLKDVGFGRILVIESSADGGMRCLVLRRKGLACEVENAVQTQQSSQTGIEQGLQMLTQLLGRTKPPKDVLLLTDEARFIHLEISLSATPGEGGKKDAQKEIDAAVRKAVEPYLDVPVQSAILAYMVSRSIVPVGETRGKDTVLVSAMALALYRRWKKVLEKQGFRLHAAIPAEVAFYSAAARGIDKDECVLVAEAREEAIGLGAILGDGGLVGYQSIPGSIVGGGATLTDLAGAMSGLLYEINGAGLEVGRAMVVGPGLDDPKNMAALREAIGGIEITAWKPDVEVKSDASVPLALYTPLLAAGISWLSREKSPVPVVTDRVTLLNQIRQQVHLVPLLAMALVLLGFSVHYAYMKISVQLHENRIECLRAEQEKLKKEIENGKKERNELKRMREEAKRSDEIAEFVEKTLPGRNRSRITLLREVRNAIPEDVVLDSMLQKDLAHYELRGRTLRAASATRFVSRLKELGVVRDVNMQAIEEMTGPTVATDPPSGNGLYYSFVIDVTLEVK